MKKEIHPNTKENPYGLRWVRMTVDEVDGRSWEPDE
jgi:hypothetical protein